MHATRTSSSSCGVFHYPVARVSSVKKVNSLFRVSSRSLSHTVNVRRSSSLRGCCFACREDSTLTLRARSQPKPPAGFIQLNHSHAGARILKQNQEDYGIRHVCLHDQRKGDARS